MLYPEGLSIQSRVTMTTVQVKFKVIKINVYFLKNTVRQRYLKSAINLVKLMPWQKKECQLPKLCAELAYKTQAFIRSCKD